MPESKVCKDCSRELPIEKFQRHYMSPDGFAHRCKECITKRRMAVEKRKREQRNAPNNNTMPAIMPGKSVASPLPNVEQSIPYQSRFDYLLPTPPAFWDKTPTEQRMRRYAEMQALAMICIAYDLEGKWVNGQGETGKGWDAECWIPNTPIARENVLRVDFTVTSETNGKTMSNKRQALESKDIDAIIRLEYDPYLRQIIIAEIYPPNIIKAFKEGQCQKHTR